MFFLVPFAIFVVSSVIIGIVISRKFVYLKKLAPEVIEQASGTQMTVGSLFGELTTSIRKSDIRGFFLHILADFEKFLRQLRLLSLKIDALTNSLIARIRSAAKRHEKIMQETPVTEDVIASRSVRPLTSESETPMQSVVNHERYLREEEQRLIMAIAKSPKNAQLYKELGDVYLQTLEFDDARQSFERALELDPGDHVVTMKLDRLLRTLMRISGESH